MLHILRLVRRRRDGRPLPLLPLLSVPGALLTAGLGLLLAQ